MSHLLSESQLTTLRSLFHKADTTGIGSLPAAQIVPILRVALAADQAVSSGNGGAASSSGTGGQAASLSDAALEMKLSAMLSQVDVAAGEHGGSGRADLEEFVNIFCQSFHQDSEEAAADGTGGEAGGVGGGNNSLSLLSASELSELRQAFHQIDIDGDGLLSLSELKSAFQSIGEHWSESELALLVADLDTSRKGKVRLEDFLAALSPA